MTLEIVRLVRTPSSERHVLRRKGLDVAGLEIHFLANLTVQATLILFENSGLGEGDIPGLLSHIDHLLLPDVQLDQRNLAFTVISGSVIGIYQAEPEAP